jgi:hypothetical protein
VRERHTDGGNELVSSCEGAVSTLTIDDLCVSGDTRGEGLKEGDAVLSRRWQDDGKLLGGAAENGWVSRRSTRRGDRTYQVMAMPPRAFETSPSMRYVNGVKWYIQEDQNVGSAETG